MTTLKKNLTWFLAVLAILAWVSVARADDGSGDDGSGDDPAIAVPELDPRAAGLALGVVAAGLFVVTGRRPRASARA